MIGQEILCYDSVGRISKLLDQMCAGLRTLGVLEIIRAFPELFAPLLVYMASVSANNVNESIYVDESISNILPGDLVTLAHLKRWVSEASEEYKLHNTVDPR